MCGSGRFTYTYAYVLYSDGDHKRSPMTFAKFFVLWCLCVDEPPRYGGDRFKRMAKMMPTNDEEDIGVLFVRFYVVRFG